MIITMLPSGGSGGGEPTSDGIIVHTYPNATVTINGYEWNDGEPDPYRYEVDFVDLYTGQANNQGIAIYKPTKDRLLCTITAETEEHYAEIYTAEWDRDYFETYGKYDVFEPSVTITITNSDHATINVYESFSQWRGFSNTPIASFEYTGDPIEIYLKDVDYREDFTIIATNDEGLTDGRSVTLYEASLEIKLTLEEPIAPPTNFNAIDIGIVNFSLTWEDSNLLLDNEENSDYYTWVRVSMSDYPGTENNTDMYNTNYTFGNYAENGWDISSSVAGSTWYVSAYTIDDTYDEENGSYRFRISEEARYSVKTNDLSIQTFRDLRIMPGNNCAYLSFYVESQTEDDVDTRCACITRYSTESPPKTYTEGTVGVDTYSLRNNEEYSFKQTYLSNDQEYFFTLFPRVDIDGRSFYGKGISGSVTPRELVLNDVSAPKAESVDNGVEISWTVPMNKEEDNTKVIWTDVYRQVDGITTVVSPSYMEQHPERFKQLWSFSCRDQNGKILVDTDSVLGSETSLESYQPNKTINYLFFAKGYAPDGHDYVYSSVINQTAIWNGPSISSPKARASSNAIYITWGYSDIMYRLTQTKLRGIQVRMKQGSSPTDSDYDAEYSFIDDIQYDQDIQEKSSLFYNPITNLENGITYYFIVRPIYVDRVYASGDVPNGRQWYGPWSKAISATPLEEVLRTVSWEELANYKDDTAEKKYLPHDTKKIEITGQYAQTITVEIADYNHEDFFKNDKQGLTFICKNLLKDSYTFNVSDYKNKGYSETPIHTELLPAILEGFPGDLKSYIKEITKIQAIEQRDGTDRCETFTCKLFLLSEFEVIRDPYDKMSDGTCYKNIFGDVSINDNNTRIKKMNDGAGEAASYWLTRNAGYADYDRWGSIDKDGAYSHATGKTNGICFGFTL